MNNQIIMIQRILYICRLLKKGQTLTSIKLNTIYVLVKRNIIVRYKHSILGILWGFIKPIVYLLIFIVVFSSQFPTSESYILYFLSAILFWFFFANVVSQGMLSIVGSSGILKSITLQPANLVIAELLSETFNLFLSFIVFFSIAPFLGFQFTVYLIYLPFYFLLFAIFTAGILFLTATAHTFFRDIGLLWNTIQPALFYLTPIAYKAEIIPERFQFILYANPIFYYIQLFRYSLVEYKLPDSRFLIITIAISFITYFIGYMLFNRFKSKFISVI